MRPVGSKRAELERDRLSNRKLRDRKEGDCSGTAERGTVAEHRVTVAEHRGTVAEHRVTVAELVEAR